jgi:hypothetical protein
MLIIHVYDYDGLMNIPYTCYSGTHPPALSPITRPGKGPRSTGPFTILFVPFIKSSKNE